jgi:hypothetical protein
MTDRSIAVSSLIFQVPHHIPFPVPVKHPVAIPVPQIVKVPQHVPVPVEKPVPVELHQQVCILLIIFFSSLSLSCV